MELNDAKTLGRLSDKPLVIAGIGVSAESWQEACLVVEELLPNASLLDPSAGNQTAGNQTHWASASVSVVLAIVGLSDLAELSKNEIANLTVVSRRKPLPIQPGGVYVGEAGASLLLREGELHAVEINGNEQNTPIDHLFESLANCCGELAVGVILSGRGTDGTLGLRAISDAGGMTIAQDPETAAQRSMPQSALALGIVDHILSAERIAAEIRSHTQHMTAADESDDVSELNRQIIVAIPQIAAAIETHTQNDFKHYKTTTLARRIRRRIHVLKLPNVDTYVELLQSSREESLQLFRDLLISVTAFFRDPKAFDSLADSVLTQLVNTHMGDGPLRIWVPGCATGQEAYSIAILLHEIVERSERSVSFQIFATDLDDRALNIARAGGYPVGIQDEVASGRLQKYFTKRGNKFYVSKMIRDSIVFSAHNLISDPPFTKLDLISCRNLLIYLGSHLQKKLIPLFHYAIKPGGFLFLGPWETLSVNRELFRTMHQQHRLFQRRLTALDSPPTLDVRLVNLSRFSQLGESEGGEVDLFRYAQQIILGEFSPQWAIVDDDGEIHSLSSDPAPFLQMSSGKFNNNFIAMAHENIRIGLRAAFTEAKRHRRRALAEDMSITVDGGLQRVHITVQPMPEMGADEGLHLVAFHRIGTPLRIDEDPNTDPKIDATTIVDKTARRVIEQLELELSRIRDALERTVQELESSNEELKSSNEELLSMNEELQSANEELETSKEELQTSNEQLARSNNDIQNLLRSTRIATVFLDNELRIRGFTPAVCEIYDLQEADVGRPLARFVPLVNDMPPLPSPEAFQKRRFSAAETILGNSRTQQVDNGNQVIEDTIVADSGKTFLRRSLPYQSHAGDFEGIVLTFVDVTELHRAKAEVEATGRQLRTFTDTVPPLMAIVDDDKRFVFANQAYADYWQRSVEEVIGAGIQDIVSEEAYAAIKPNMQRALAGERVRFELTLHRPDHGELMYEEVVYVPQSGPNGKVEAVHVVITDVTERVRNEQKLAEIAARLESMLNSAIDGIITINARGVIASANPAALKLFGYSSEELIGQNVSMLMPEPWHSEHDSYLSRYMETSEAKVIGIGREVRGLRKDGSEFDMDLQVGEAVSLGQRIFVGTIRDITDSKRRQTELIDREAHLRRVINNQLGLVGVIDRDGILLEVDDRSLAAARTRREVVIGRHFADAPWWSYDEAVAQQMRDAMQRAFAGEVVRYDVSLFSHGDEGMMIDFMIAPVFDADGKVEYLIPSGVDIRQRYAAQNRLKESENRFRVMADGMPLLVWVHDHTGRQTAVNKAFCDFYNVREEQMRDMEWQKLAHPDDFQQYTQEFARCVKDRSPFHGEVRVRRADGQWRWLESWGQPTFSETGEYLGHVGASADITERRESLEQVRIARAAAEAANASKSEFLANMSHEIRTPMTAILGYADLLRELVEQEEARGYLRTIRRNGDYLLEIINDILDLSKIEAGKFEVEQERFELRRVVEDVRSIMAVRASEGGLSLAVEYDGKLPKIIQSDAKRLKQILINLIGNAIKFTREGRVDIRVKFDATARSIRFDVTDTGVGMSPEQQEKLFKPFSQGDSSVSRHFGGTGLGLAISQRLTGMLGGTIAVSSTLGIGSTFSVSVAIGTGTKVELVDYNESQPGRDSISLSDFEPVQLDCHVLVVDDRRDIRFLSKHILTKAGATVEECEDGQIAVDRIAGCLESNDCPDLILLDMQMPNLDGYQTARELRELGYAGPIIALTADAMQGDMNQCIEAGCNDYLSKPINADRLVRMVEALT